MARKIGSIVKLGGVLTQWFIPTGNAPYELVVKATGDEWDDAHMKGFVDDMKLIEPDAVHKVFYDETEKHPWVYYCYRKRGS